MIEEDFSPQQIEGRLKFEKQPFVSHETIYKIIREDKQQGGKLDTRTCHQLKYRKRPVSEKYLLKTAFPSTGDPKLSTSNSDSVIGNSIQLWGKIIKVQF
jgi:IS30 family transposase